VRDHERETASAGANRRAANRQPLASGLRSRRRKLNSNELSQGDFGQLQRWQEATYRLR
jgi:hypothetical protein